MRRVRPTLLLQSVLAGLCLAILVGTIALFGKGMSLAVAAALALFWLIAYELELLPLFLESQAVRWAQQHPDRASSRWFVDVDAEARRERDRQRTDVQSNPTLW